MRRCSSVLFHYASHSSIYLSSRLINYDLQAVSTSEGLLQRVSIKSTVLKKKFSSNNFYVLCIWELILYFSIIFCHKWINCWIWATPIVVFIHFSRHDLNLLIICNLTLVWVCEHEVHLAKSLFLIRNRINWCL